MVFTLKRTRRKAKFFEALYDADTGRIRQAFRKNRRLANCPDKTEGKLFPLVWASRHGIIEVVRILAENGARVHCLQGSLALLEAAIGNHVQVAKLLLEHGAHVNARDEQGETALFKACENNQMDLVQLLLEHGAKPNLKDKKRNTPLLRAASMKHSQIVEWLLENKARVTDRDENDDTPLLLAVKSTNGDNQKRTQIVRALLEHGADPNALNRFGNSPLFLSILQPDPLEDVRLLLQHGATVNARNSHGETPLMIATRQNCTQVVKLLVEHGANVNAKSQFGSTPLLLAVSRNSAAVVKLLLQHGAGVDETLQLAVYKRYPDLVQLLILQGGANVNFVCNGLRRTPLFVAIDHNDFDMVQLLVRNGAKMDICNKRGETPLSRACALGHVDLIYKLLSTSPHLYFSCSS